jgi:UPF0176 protein
MNEQTSQFKTILFYRYINISEESVKTLKDVLKAVCAVLGLKGRILIAREGINGTVEGKEPEIEVLKKHILSYKHFRKMDIKESNSSGSSFPKIKVKIKDEIVSTKYPKHIDPTKKTGKKVNAKELDKLYDKDEEFYVIDMRNDYEIKSGHFKNTINADWDMKASRDLPKFIDKLAEYKSKKVLTVCTGGIRCEKMSAYLMDQGFQDVSQLHNGIHTYMQKYPGKNFRGTLYTFDNRMTMEFADDKGIPRDIVGECYACEKDSEKTNTEKYGHCAFTMCHQHLLLCDKHLQSKVYCTEQCRLDEQLVQSRVANYMTEALHMEQ